VFDAMLPEERGGATVLYPQQSESQVAAIDDGVL
jgi:hypothetical protein